MKALLKNRKRFTALLIAVTVLCTLLSGCTSSGVSNTPVTLTMWHNFSGSNLEVTDGLINEFNETVGKEKGIVVSVTSLSYASDQNEKLMMIAAGDSGAPEMPDLVPAYPAMAVILMNEGLLAPLDDYFTDEQLNAYLPQFIAEGRLPDGKLYVFPISKSTEALFVNRTLFDRFAAQTGAHYNDLTTFEGMASLAVRYHEWTDALTPDITNDGKTFFSADTWFNIAQLGAAQMGADFIGANNLETGSEAFRRIWDAMVLPAIQGGYAVIDGYTSDLSRTGDIVCNTGSSAGVDFYPETIAYPDNTKEDVVYDVLPCPVFSGGQKIALQRGAGFVVAKSTPEKERAAAIFLEWFTRLENNLRFVANTGYMPVTAAAFEQRLADNAESLPTQIQKKLLETQIRMYQEYTFIFAPVNDNLSAMTSGFEAAIREAMRTGRERVLAGENPEAVSEELLAAFLK